MVNAIPKGYHSITPHLVVNNGVNAVEFYKRAFGAVEEYRYNGPNNKTLIYVKLRIGDSPILLFVPCIIFGRVKQADSTDAWLYHERRRLYHEMPLIIS